MADERPPITGGDASDFEAAAKRLKAKAESVKRKADEVTTDNERALRERENGLRKEAQAASAEYQEAGKRTRAAEGRLKAAQTRLRKLQEGPRLLTADQYTEAAQRARASIERAQGPVEIARAEEQNLRERAQATSAELGAVNAERRAIRRDAQAARERATVANAAASERPPQGDLAELERVARQHSARMAAALDPEGRRRLAAAQAPITGQAEQRRALAELQAARAPRVNPPLQLRTAGGGGRDVVAHIAQLELQAEQKIARAQERREVDKLVRAEAAERAAIEKRTTAELEAARAAEQAPGTELIRHPTEFGRRVPGPFGQVTEPAQIGFPSNAPQPRPRGTPPRDVYAQRPRTAASSIGETKDEVAIYKSAALEKARAARLQAAASRVADQAAEQHATNVAYAAQAEQSYAERLAESEQGMRRWSAQMGVTDQSMRRHGTLTTEFITAAAKGEVAYKEWGWQIGAAAAKFGAWTAAGAGIYGVLGAMTKLGQGAIASASGVDSLKRSVNDVNSGQAQQSFRQQAAHFNVPISTAVDAQTRMGAVFHNQADAATAATAALYALQTGQVDVEQSTKDLIAIQQAYGSSAKDLTTLFDELNFVQNRYGARIPDMETGIAAAAGSFKQMGGSLEELIAAFTVLQRHGTSGNIASTIFRRIPNELAKPGNQDVLRRAGVDPTARFPVLLRQAQQAVARGMDPRIIAKAMGGPQWAGRLMNLLTDTHLYGQVSGQLERGEARGASERELQHVKDQASEVLKGIGVQLEVLGSNLAQSGLGVVFVSMAKAVQELLQVTNTLLGVFNQLPGPIKTALAYVGTGMAALAGARRLGLGGALANRGALGARAAPYLIETDERRTRRLVGKGLRDSVRATADEAESLTNKSYAAAAAADRTLRSEAAKFAEIDRQLVAGTLDEKTAAEQKARIARQSTVAAERAREAAIQATLALEEAERQYELQAAFQKKMAATAVGQRNAVAREFAVQEGMYIRPSLGADVPAAERVRQIQAQSEAAIAARTGVGGAPVLAGSGAGAKATEAAEAAVAASEAQASQARRLKPAIAEQARGYRQLARDTTLLNAAQVAGASAARAAGSGLRAAGTGLRGLAASLGAALGPLDYLLLGFLAFTEAKHYIDEQQHQLEDRLQQLQRPSSDPGQLRRRAAALRGEARSLGVPPAGAARLGVELPPAQVAAAKGAQAQQALADRLQQQQQLGRDLDVGAVKLRYQAEKAAASTPKQQYAAIQRAITAIDQGYEALVAPGQLRAARKRGDKGAVQDLQKQIKAANDYKNFLYDAQNQLAGLGTAVDQALAAAQDFEQLGKFIDLQAARLELAGHSRGAVRALGRATVQAARNFAAGRGNVADYLKSLKDVEQDVTTNAETELNAALAVARTPTQRHAARTAYLSTVRQGFGIPAQQRNINALAGQQANRQRQINLLQVRQTLAGQGGITDPLTGAALGGFPGGLSDDQQARLTRLLQGYKDGAKRAHVLAQGLQYMKRQFKAIKQAQQQADYADQSAVFDAQTAVGAANQPAGGARIAYQIQRAGQAVARALRRFGRNSVEYLQAVNNAQQLAEQAVQEQAGLIQANAALAEASASGPRGEFLASVGGLQRLLGFQKAHPRVYSPSDVVNTQAQIVGANKAENQRQAEAAKQAAEDAKQAAEQARQDFVELFDARYAYYESLTDDPVKIAKLEAQKATRFLAHGGFKNAAERYNAMADKNTKVRALHDATAQQRIDNIDYEVDIGKMTTDQEIKALQRLLHWQKLSGQMRKDIKQKIGRLRHDAETSSDLPELDVGNIRLPTVYDVRRLMRQGTQTNVVQNNVVHVDARGQDPQALVGHLNRHFNTQTKAGMRAAGVRG